MKKFLSTVLALVMVMTTFAMLVPNALAAATEQNIEAKVLYEENFDDLDGKTPAEILAGANMKDEYTQTGVLDEMSVNHGKLTFGTHASQDAYLILKDNPALANGYIVEYDIEFLAKHANTNGGDGITFITGEGNGYTTNQGRCGWTSQMRYNTNVLSSVNSAGWKSPKNETPTSLSDYGGTMQNKRTSVKAVFDPANKKIQTFAQPYKAELDAWDEATMAMTWTTTEDYSSVFGNDLRLIVYLGIEAAIDNLKVTSLDGTQVIYTENFDDIEATANDAILSEINWTSHQRNAYDANVRCADGRLIVGDDTANVTTTAQQELILVENSEDAKNGFVVEYDFEIQYGTSGGNGFGFHSAKATSTGGHGSRNGWVSQIRWGRSVLSGANSGGWVEYNNGTDYNNSHIVSLTRDSGAINGFRLAVRAVFDPAAGYVTTYAKTYTGEPLTWTEADAVQKSNDLSAYTNLLDGTVRLVVYETLVLSIDNIKVTALEKTPNAVGYQEHETENQIRLLGVIDNDIFTKAEKVGFRVTMTKTAGGDPVTKDIDCNYVYSSITAWESEATTAAGFMHGASHVYALHIKGITESVNIVVTPYYVDEGVMYLGDASETIAYVVD